MSLHDNESGKVFELKSAYKPSGDQPQAIEKLVAGIESGKKAQTLLGVTGSGKTLFAWRTFRTSLAVIE